MSIFEFKKKFNNNYLRIYGNLERVEYSNNDKQKIAEYFIELVNNLYDYPKLKYDLSGVGYGIAKGAPLLGQKAFNNRIKNKGYSRLTGMTICAEKHDFSSVFMLLDSPPHAMSYLDAYFSWPFADDKNLDNAITILKNLSKIVKIAYAFAYPTTRFLSCSGEMKVSKCLFSTSYSTLKTEILWNGHIPEIKTGMIKKLYPINWLNQLQIKRLELNKIAPTEIIKMANGNEIWQFESSELKKLNLKATNTILS